MTTDLVELETIRLLLEGPDSTPVYEHASNVDGNHPPRHYSAVFHANHRGMEVARFIDDENHRNDAKLFIWFRTHGLSLISTNRELVAALDCIADDAEEFTHGDTNAETFVRGFAKRARAALSPTQPKSGEVG